MRYLWILLFVLPALGESFTFQAGTNKITLLVSTNSPYYQNLIELKHQQKALDRSIKGLPDRIAINTENNSNVVDRLEEMWQSYSNAARLVNSNQLWILNRLTN